MSFSIFVFVVFGHTACWPLRRITSICLKTRCNCLFVCFVLFCGCVYAFPYKRKKNEKKKNKKKKTGRTHAYAECSRCGGFGATWTQSQTHSRYPLATFLFVCLFCKT